MHESVEQVFSISCQLGICPCICYSAAEPGTIRAVKPGFLTPEKREPKVIKTRDRQSGTVEALQWRGAGSKNL